MRTCDIPKFDQKIFDLTGIRTISADVSFKWLWTHSVISRNLIKQMFIYQYENSINIFLGTIGDTPYIYDYEHQLLYTAYFTQSEEDVLISSDNIYIYSTYIFVDKQHEKHLYFQKYNFTNSPAGFKYDREYLHFKICIKDNLMRNIKIVSNCPSDFEEYFLDVVTGFCHNQTVYLFSNNTVLMVPQIYFEPELYFEKYNFTLIPIEEFFHADKPLTTTTTTTTTTTVPSTMTTSFNFTTDFVPTTNRSELVLSKKYNFYTWKKNFYLNFSI